MSTENQQDNTKSDTLSKRQRSFLPVMLQSKTVSAACEAFGIDRATYYKWSAQPDFAAAIEAQQRERTGAAVAALKMNLESATDKLIELLQCETPSIQMRAAVELLNFYLKAVHADDVEKRIAELEAGKGPGAIRNFNDFYQEDTETRIRWIPAETDYKNLTSEELVAECKRRNLPTEIFEQ